MGRLEVTEDVENEEEMEKVGREEGTGWERMREEVSFGVKAAMRVAPHPHPQPKADMPPTIVPIHRTRL